MSDISLVKKHALPMAKARALVQKAADGLANEYNLKSEWVGDTLRFQRSGIQGAISVLAAEIQLEVTLGFLLKPFRGKFVENIDRNFDKLLDDAYKTASKPAVKKPASKSARKPAKKSSKAGRSS
ncbi:MAG: polyhydroxyalkanoic acid system family protein [Burkholderiaceae bacterium]